MLGVVIGEITPSHAVLSGGFLLGFFVFAYFAGKISVVDEEEYEDRRSRSQSSAEDYARVATAWRWGYYAGKFAIPVLAIVELVLLGWWLADSLR